MVLISGICMITRALLSWGWINSPLIRRPPDGIAWWINIRLYFSSLTTPLILNQISVYRSETPTSKETPSCFTEACRHSLLKSSPCFQVRSFSFWLQLLHFWPDFSSQCRMYLGPTGSASSKLIAHLVISKGTKLSSAALRFLGWPLSNKIPDFFARPAIRIDAGLKAKGRNTQYWCDLDFPFVHSLKNIQSLLIFLKELIVTAFLSHLHMQFFQN